jgi:ubiquinone/menaquinone biosynthesis C-methylase UbiE
MERLRFAAWRTKLRDRITGEIALEVGVGTGKNLPYYPQNVNVTAIDLSPRMLEGARKKASALGLEVKFMEMDVQHLDFPENAFDSVFATFVFCSVTDPVLGLQELKRVCKPDGKLLLLEDMRPGNPILGLLFDMFNPMVVRMMGANINRRTVENIRKAGWRIQVEEQLSSDMVRWIEAEPLRQGNYDA